MFQMFDFGNHLQKLIKSHLMTCGLKWSVCEQMSGICGMIQLKDASHFCGKLHNCSGSDSDSASKQENLQPLRYSIQFMFIYMALLQWRFKSKQLNIAVLVNRNRNIYIKYIKYI